MEKKWFFGFAVLLLTGFFLMTCQFEEGTEEDWDELLKKHGDFADNHVLLVLTKDASMKLDKIYIPKDFPEISCYRVIDLSESLLPIIKMQIEAEKTGIWPPELDEHRRLGMLINIENFRRILCIELKNNNKINVLKAVKLLSARKDIESAEPDYIMQWY